jgi:hypothetical protein
MSKNLQEFWTIQKCSGEAADIFASFEEAEAASEEWNNKLDADFEKWQRGESVSILIDSRIESDGFGGCYQSCQVHPAARPGGICHFPAYACYADDWRNNPGFHKIRWGNPATARTSKK